VLPWQRTAKKVDENISEGLQIIASSLFDAQMAVDRGIASSASQALVGMIGNVVESVFITILVRKTEIDDVDLVAILMHAHE
jgi:hypothetical protein